MLFSVVKQEAARALKKWGETLAYRLSSRVYPYTSFGFIAASCVLYNRTELSQGFFICFITYGEKLLSNDWL